MSSDDNALGEFLQARREQLDPGQAGVPDLGRRRVPGLRREELAVLAGVSSPYYTRLFAFHADPGSADEKSLLRLRQIAAGREPGDVGG